MLEKEPLVALNEALSSCLKAKTRYETLSSAVGDERLEEMFMNASRSRAKTAGELEEAVKAMGGLPLDPDPEKEALEGLWVKIKAALTDDELDALLGEVVNLENEIDERCDRALEHSIPGNAARALKRLKKDSDDFKRRLRKLGRE